MTIVTQAVFALITGAPVSVVGITPYSWFGALVVAVIGTAGFYWLYQYLIQKSDPLSASMNQYVMPFFGAIWAFAMLGDVISWIALLGGVIAIAGAMQVTGVWRVLWYSRPAHKKQNPRSD